ncbi:MAG: hypothetical protein AB1634_10325 [Thermodesulfobacteriota bacterium]
MALRLLLVCQPGEARHQYLAAIARCEAEADAVDSLAAVPATMVKSPYNGVLLDLPTRLKAAPGDRQNAQAILEQFPVVQVRVSPGDHRVHALYAGQIRETGTLEEFIREECRSFAARTARALARKVIHLNVLLEPAG